MRTSFDPGEYGRNIADRYDDTSGRQDSADEVALVSELAGSGSILEFGLGTGRLALPLVARGHLVAGIEGSEDMIGQLRRKPGGADIDVHVGDFSQVKIDDTFSLVLLAMNTIYALPSQQAQVECFGNAAAHLEPGGLFVVQAWIPDPGGFRDGRSMRLVQLGDGTVVLEAAEIHPSTQTMDTNKIFIASDSIKVFPANHRYAWPAELDLMAALAGLELAYRWRDWRKGEYTDSSTTHVSVWRKR